MKKNTYVVMFSTAGNEKEAYKIANHLVKNHLVACVNIVPSLRSVYWWNNKVNHDNEVLMILKTKTKKVPKIEKAIRALHSYDTPELIAFQLQYGLPRYLQWMDGALSAGIKK